jgi:hypothetical protein
MEKIEVKKIAAGIILSFHLKFCELGRTQENTDLENEMKAVPKVCPLSCQRAHKHTSHMHIK